MAKLAIDDPEIGPRLKQVRVLRPDEVEAVELIKQVREQVEKLNALDKEMQARLEGALDHYEDLRDLMKTYLTREARLRVGVWPEGEGFLELEEAQLIQAFVIRTYRDDLVGFQIACVFQEQVTPVNRRARLGTQMRLPGKMRHLSGWDAVTTLDFTRWCHLTDRDRQRLVHHELEHLEVGDEGNLMIRSHDVEDFISVLKTYGTQSESGRFSADRLQEIYGADGIAQLNLMGTAG